MVITENAMIARPIETELADLKKYTGEADPAARRAVRNASSRLRGLAPSTIENFQTAPLSNCFITRSFS